MTDQTLKPGTPVTPGEPLQAAPNPQSNIPKPAAKVPDSQEKGDQRGHVGIEKDARSAVGTGTIPAVDDTTLTQAPHPDTLPGGAYANPNAEPFGREMNDPRAEPGKNFVRDPQVFPRAEHALEKGRPVASRKTSDSEQSGTLHTGSVGTSSTVSGTAQTGSGPPPVKP